MKERVRLSRLFRAARVAPENQIEAMPSHLKTRILAHWRADAEGDDWFIPLALRRALICATLVMVVCVAWCSKDLWSDSDNELTVANLEVEQDLIP